MATARNRQTSGFTLRPTWRMLVLAGLALGAAAACERIATAPGAGASANVVAADGTGSIGGTVVSLDGKPVGGAVVTTPDGASAVTGEDGSFSIDGLAPTDRLAVDVSAPGFASTLRIYRVVPGEQLSREIRVIPEGEPVTIIAGQGGVVPFGGEGSVEVPANAFAGVSPDEPVIVRVDYYDPADPERFRAAPGDFSGIEEDGSESVLSSNGMVSVRAASVRGEPLVLAEEQVLRVNVPGRSPTTCRWGLYRLDSTTGRWILVRPVAAPAPGTTTTWVDAAGVRWNIDCWIQSVRVPIQIVDAVGNPVRNLSVTASGLSYFGGAETWTDANGFATLPLGADQRVSVQAGSASVTLTTPSEGSSGPVARIVL